MIGLDTSVVLRYLLQDDPAQTRQANQILERQLRAENPGFLNLAIVLEIVWVLCSVLEVNRSDLLDWRFPSSLEDGFLGR